MNQLEAITFARPGWLWLVAIVPGLWLLFKWANRQRQQALRQFGRHDLVAGRLDRRDQSMGRKYARIAMALGLGLCSLAAAGPRYGAGGEKGVTIGRDLVLVLDLSRSMTAADMADRTHQERWQAAKAGIEQLITQFRQRGGHRLGLVVFAAKPWVVCPLTSDYDHFEARLQEFSPKSPPPEVRPEPDENISTGTVIGAGIYVAVDTHDPRFIGYQDIILFSDGDGPGVDREIEYGVKHAAQRQIPVHVFGLGDPNKTTELTIGTGAQADVVDTKLREEVLKEITRRTQGEYVASQRDLPQVGAWFEGVLAPRASRELPDDAIPQAKERYQWPLALGILLLLIGWRWDQ